MRGGDFYGSLVPYGVVVPFTPAASISAAGAPLPQSGQEKADIAEMSAFDETCRIYPMRHTDSSQVSTSFLTWSFAIPYRSWIIPSS